MSLIVPAATAAATTATLWFVPLIVAAVSFYQYDKTDPEGRPKDTKVLSTNRINLIRNDLWLSISFPGHRMQNKMTSRQSNTHISSFLFSSFKKKRRQSLHKNFGVFKGGRYIADENDEVFHLVVGRLANSPPPPFSYMFWKCVCVCLR